jgi:hypothetical protein
MFSSGTLQRRSFLFCKQNVIFQKQIGGGKRLKWRSSSRGRSFGGDSSGGASSSWQYFRLFKSKNQKKIASTSQLTQFVGSQHKKTITRICTATL